MDDQFVAALRLVFERLARAQEEWNRVRMDEHHGADDYHLVIDLAEDGSGQVAIGGRLGTLHPQCVFADIEELVSYLNAYCGG